LLKIRYDGVGGRAVRRYVRGEVRMRDRRKPLAEPAMASEPSMKRKPQAFFWMQKIPQVGNLLWKAKPFGIAECRNA
jgi:hypothetical protein